MYRLPVLIMDSGSPPLSSTNTLSVRVCDCDSDGVALSCGAVAYTATGLSTGALLAILGCIITLLGKINMTQGPVNILELVEMVGLVWCPQVVDIIYKGLFTPAWCPVEVFSSFSFGKSRFNTGKTPTCIFVIRKKGNQVYLKL